MGRAGRGEQRYSLLRMFFTLPVFHAPIFLLNFDAPSNTADVVG